MTNLTLEEKVAKALFDVKAVKINVGEPFTFASGIKSPIYCDNRYVLGFSKERDTIVEAFVERIGKTACICEKQTKRSWCWKTN